MWNFRKEGKMFMGAYRKETVVRIIPQPGDYLEPGIPKRVSMKAKVMWKNTKVKDLNGEEVVSNVNLNLPVIDGLYYDSKFEVDGVEFDIVFIDRIDDFSARYLIVYLS
jgi:hypothetical protein